MTASSSLRNAFSCGWSQTRSTSLCSLAGELPQRLGDVREVGEELRQVLDHSQQPLNPSDIRGPWYPSNGLHFSGVCPEAFVVTCPINGTSCLLSLTLLLFILMPLAAHLRRKASRFWSWSLTASSRVSPNPMTTKSSATTSTPCNPSMSWCIRR